MHTHDAGRDPAMPPRLTVLTLGVDELARAVAFYRDGLGWPTKGIVGEELAHGAVAFFDLQPGLRLALWARADLAHDLGISPSPASATECSLGYNVASAEAVDAAMAVAARAGARIVKPAGRTFWGGYAGYFQDPDGHAWEVVWNPAWEDAPADSASAHAGAADVQALESVLVGAADPGIVALEAAIRRAQLDADVQALDALVGGELLFTGPDGQLGTKAQDLEAHGSGVVRFREHEPEELRVRRVGDDVAVSALRARLAVEVAGTLVRGTFRYTRVWAREGDGRWRVVGGHVSEVPASG